MANTAGQWHALTGCYGQHRRRVARSNWLLWPTPQASSTFSLAVMANTEGHVQQLVQRAADQQKSNLYRRAAMVALG